MKSRLLSLVVLASLVLALSFPVAVPAAPPAAKPQPAAPAPERHPEIRAAIESLLHAREHLNHADHDFGGHRVDAIRAIDAALNQLQTCLQYDK